MNKNHIKRSSTFSVHIIRNKKAHIDNSDKIKKYYNFKFFCNIILYIILYYIICFKLHYFIIRELRKTVLCGNLLNIYQ